MKAFKHIRRSVAISSLIFVPALEVTSKAAPVEVTPSNMNGWAFVSTDDNGALPSAAPYTNAVGQMVTGPATPPLGTGSAQLTTAPNGGDGAEAISTANYDGTPLADLTSLGYYTYDTVNNGQQFPYIEMAVSTTGGNTEDDALFFEPPYQTPATGGSGVSLNQGATVMNQWQSWDALDGAWWDNNGFYGTPGGGYDLVGSLSSFLLAYPNATIVDNQYPGGYGGVALRVGYGSSTDNYNGYVDAFSIGIDGVNTTYDFDPNSVPEPASLSLLALGAPLLLRRRRRA